MYDAISHGERFRQLLRRIGPTEKYMLLSIVIACLLLYGFVELADEVLEGETATTDARVLRFMDDIAGSFSPTARALIQQAMRDITAMGGTVILTGVTLAAAGFFLLVNKSHAALLVVSSVGMGTVVSTVLKWGFERPRPDLFPHAVTVYTASFPSGHSLLSAIVYLTLGALLARSQPDPRVKLYLMSVAAVVTVCVGISRVYLGVHWPTDVIAGWALGAAWAALSWTVMLWLQNRGVVEPSDGNSSRPE